MMIYISVSENLSGIIKNAIAVNELNPRENSNGTKAFIGTVEFGSDYIFVRIIVENRTQKLFDYDILYAINKKSIKKEDVRPRRTDYLANKGSDTSSTISISDMLEIVKENSDNIKLVTSVLSKDVCEKIGIERPKSVFNEDVIYSFGDEYEQYLQAVRTVRLTVRLIMRMSGEIGILFLKIILETMLLLWLTTFSKG